MYRVQYRYPYAVHIFFNNKIVQIIEVSIICYLELVYSVPVPYLKATGTVTVLPDPHFNDPVPVDDQLNPDS
jgi:hypothetical protein